MDKEGLKNMTKPKNPAAVALGKLAKGKPKNFSPEELARRTKIIQKAVADRKLNNQSKGKAE